MDFEKAIKSNAILIGSSEDHAIKAEYGRKQAETYARREGPRFHPLFSVPASFDNQRVQLKADKLASLRSHTDQFYDAIEIYQRKITKDNVLPSQFAVRGRHTWDEVFQAAKDASKQSKNIRGFKGWMKKIGRGAIETAPYIQPLLDIVPNGDYTGALCGGLKIAFSIAARMREKREAILDAFEGLPQTIQMAEHCRTRHPHDQALSDAAIELYLAILDAVINMIHWLVGPSTWKKYWSALSPSLTEKPVEMSLSDVRQQTEQLSYRAGKLESDATVETNIITKDVHSDVKHTNVAVEELRIMTERVDLDTHHIKEKTDAIIPLASGTHQLVTDIATEVRKLASCGLESIIQDVIKDATWKEKREKYKRHRQALRLEKEKVRLESAAMLEKKVQLYEQEVQLRQAQVNIYKEQIHRLGSQLPSSSAHSAYITNHLSALLNVSPESDARDQEHVSRVGRDAPSAALAKSYWILNHQIFRAWLISDESGNLFVDGHDRSLESERLSSASLVCATLIQALKNSEQATTLAFFCSLHTGDAASLRGPQGLMRSLIHQLLPLQDFDFNFISHDYAERIRSEDVGWLCDLFVKLVDQLSKDEIIFCVIDGSSAFEKQKYGTGVLLVVDHLSKLAQRLGSFPVFKFLLTTSKGSRQIKQLFASDDCINVPRSSEVGREITGNYLVKHAKQLLSPKERPPITTLQEIHSTEGTSAEVSSPLLGIKSGSEDDDSEDEVQQNLSSVLAPRRSQSVGDRTPSLTMKQT